jgi:gamma-glutamylcysteine synthetase
MKVALSLSLLCCAGFVSAEAVKLPMAPGLWEVNTKMVSDDPKIAAAMEQAQKQMENLPPEQKKMMQDMMKKQGVSMDMQGGAVTLKMCLTQDMIDMNQGLTQNQAGCKPNMQKIDANSYKFSYTCDNAASGEGTYTFSGADAYTYQMKVTTGSGAGAQKMSMSGTGKLLNADCGDVKPFEVPKI